MEKSTSRTGKAILLFLSSFLYFFLAYIGFKKQNIQLSDYDHITSVISDNGTGYRYDSKGKKSACFYLQLEDVDKKLGVYRMSKNYKDLLDKFTNGDTVTVYYRDNSNTDENINIDLIQVEKAGKIVLDKKEYERKESTLIYIGLFTGLLTVFLSYLYYKGKILADTA